MNIGTLLSDGWNTVWNNKWILLLGIIATLAGGGSGSGGGGNSTELNAKLQDAEFIEEQFGPEAIDRMAEGPLGPIIRAFELGIEPSGEDISVAVSDLIAPLMPFIIISTIIGLILWGISQLGRAGLIHATNELAEGRSSSFGEAFSAGTGFFGRIFVMKLIVFFLTVVLFFITFFLPVLLVSIIPQAGILFCLLIPLIFIIFVVIVFADGYGYRAVVLDGKSPMDALRHGYALFRKELWSNLGLGLIMGIIASIIASIIGIIIGLLALGAAYSFFQSGGEISFEPIINFLATGELPAGFTAGAIGVSLITTAITAVIFSPITSWQSATFTHAYRALTGRGTAEDEFGRDLPDLAVDDGMI